MATKPFLIAPLNSGFENNVEPWLIPDDAFEVLENMYVFRGRVRKRFGATFVNTEVDLDVAQLNSRLRINIGTTAAVTGNFPATVVPGNVYKIGQMFSIGDTMFTVISNVAGFQFTLSTGAAVGEFNITTGQFRVTGNNENPSTPVFFYPATPVMGLLLYQSDVDPAPTYAFDTQFSYQFSGGGWNRLGTQVWTGSDSQFFWGETWRGVTPNDRFFFVTNFNAADGIQYWDGAAWNLLQPLYQDVPESASAQRVITSRIIVNFKNRLLLLNVTEQVGGVSTNFKNRCRFSVNGDPTAVNAWRQDIPGNGGFIDCPSSEAIVSVQFIKDRLIVFLQQSTWELVFIGNTALPFIWQKINTELGAESPFSSVPFDKIILSIGDVGIHACSGANVERIDQKIPTEVFEISNENNGPLRVYGIRDYFNELVYWTFPDDQYDPQYPTRILVFNYETGAWAINHDSITVFGYFYQADAATWENSPQEWQEAEFIWDDGIIQAASRRIIAGNQQGFTFLVNSGITRNAPALQITDITAGANDTFTLRVNDHNITEDDYFIIEHTQGITGLNDIVFQVSADVSDPDELIITQADVTGTYIGGGVITRVSNILMRTKQYNFFASQGRKAFIPRLDCMVSRTASGEVLIDYSPSSSNIDIVTEGIATGDLLGNGVLETFANALEPLEQTQERLWHSVFPQVDGQVIQFNIYMNDDQMKNTNISWSDIEFHAFLFWAIPVGRDIT